MKLRGREEVEGSLEAFKDVYEAQFDKPLDNAKAVEIISQMLSKRETETIQQRFFDFHPQDLKALLELLQPKTKTVKHNNKITREDKA